MRVGAITIVEATRARLIWHWIRHYKRWCDPWDMHVLVTSEGSSPEELAHIRRLIKEEGCRHSVSDAPFATNPTHELVAKATPSTFGWDGWHFSVDSDEFFDPMVDVPMLCERAEAASKEYLCCRMVDMVAPDGGYPPIPPVETSLFDVYSEEADITKAVQGSYNIKSALLKNPHYGLHHPRGVGKGKRFMPDQTWKLHHFKWDSTVFDRMRKRVANPERFPWSHEFKRFLDATGHGDVDSSSGA